MANSLQDILNELDAGGYNDSRALINSQLSQLPAQYDAQIAGLNAQKDQAFQDIANNASSRGIAYSGIPIGEQAKYIGNTYLPALAKVRQSQNDQSTALQDALNKTNIEERGKAYGIWQNQQSLDASRAAAAASSKSLADLFNQNQNGNGNANANATPALFPGMSYKNGTGGNGGYNFSWGNKPVSAATYAKVNGLPLSKLIFNMAQSGDTTAANAYRDIISSSKPDSQGNYAISPQLMAKYSPLFWGEIPTQAAGPVSKSKKPLTPANLNFLGGWASPSALNR